MDIPAVAAGDSNLATKSDLNQLAGTARKRMIEAGFGVGLMPASSIEEEIRLGTLAVLDIPELCATVPVMLIHRREGFLSPVANRLRANLVGAGDKGKDDR